MTAPRRAFLQGLVSLPLIGGGVTLVGAPTAVAEPVTERLMREYIDWLGWERWSAICELSGPFKHIDDFVRAEQQERTRSLRTRAFDWHHGNSPAAPATTRAALVLSAVGCDWQAC